VWVIARATFRQRLSPAGESHPSRKHEEWELGNIRPGTLGSDEKGIKGKNHELRQPLQRIIQGQQILARLFLTRATVSFNASLWPWQRYRRLNLWQRMWMENEYPSVSRVLKNEPGRCCQNKSRTILLREWLSINDPGRLAYFSGLQLWPSQFWNDLAFVITIFDFEQHLNDISVIQCGGWRVAPTNPSNNKLPNHSAAGTAFLAI